MSEKKKIFPKIQKKIKSFLTDESGKISKKDALGLAVGAMLLSGVDEVGANHRSWYSPALPSTNWKQLTEITSTTCSHSSGIVNGHYSATPIVNMTNTKYTHSSHSNHSSWGWC